MTDGLDEAIAAFNAGVDLRDAGRSAEALSTWDALLSDPSDGDEQLTLILGKTLHAKAHLLAELGRDADAIAAAQEATVVLADDLGLEARLLDAWARNLWAGALVSLEAVDAALAVHAGLVAELLGDDEFELRDLARRSLVGAVWIEMSRGRPESAITHARRLVASFQAEDEADPLVAAGEQVLSSAAALDWRPSKFRAAPKSLRAQAGAMRDAVIAHADEVGGEIGIAVAINARVAAGHAQALDHPIKWLTHGSAADSPPESGLLALHTVADEARRSGAYLRYAHLTVIQAGALQDLERGQDAVDLIDDAVSELEHADTNGDTRGALRILRTTRRVYSS